MMRSLDFFALHGRQPCPRAVAGIGLTEMTYDQTSAVESSAIEASPGLADWLIRENVSLAFSTYRTGKLIAVGVDAAGECSISNAQFDRVTGIAFDGRGLYLATLNQIWQLVDVSGGDESMDDFDCYYAPFAGRYTGDLGIRDVAVDGDGLPVFICSRFNCLATTSEQFHFKKLWMPEFINRLVGEDRCHLNGLAIVEGKPRYVTACAQTNYFNGWRKCRGDGGVVIDIETDEIVARSLSMPHSPRWYRGRLWLLNAGSGSFGFVDPRTYRFEHVAFCRGFARGLAFSGDYAIVGLSQSRHDPTFEGLPLKERLKEFNASILRGLMVIDLRTGEPVEYLWANDPIEEIFDVVVLPGIKRPCVSGLCHGTQTIRICPEPI